VGVIGRRGEGVFVVVAPRRLKSRHFQTLSEEPLLSTRQQHVVPDPVEQKKVRHPPTRIDHLPYAD
jgi:hypothetical protein